MKGERIPVETLKGLTEWAMLTPQQQNFMESYISNGYDSTLAAAGSYNCKTDESRRILGIRVLQSPVVMMVLALHYGDDPREAYCKMLGRMLSRGKINKEWLAAAKMLGDVRGFRQPWQPGYDKVFVPGGLNTKRAVKERTLRKAKKDATTPPPASVLPDYEGL